MADEHAARWFFRLGDGRRVTIVWLDDHASVFLGFGEAVWLVSLAGRA